MMPENRGGDDGGNIRRLRTRYAYDLESEQALLGAIIIDPDAFAKVRDTVSSDDFFLRAHQLVYAAIAELAEDGSPVDAVTIHDRLTSSGALGVAVPAELPFALAKSIGTAANVAHYASLVAATARVRRVQLAAQAVLARGLADGPRAFLDFAREKFLPVVEEPSTPTSHRIPLIRARDTEDKPVEWLIPNFLAKGELTDLSGDPGVGKGGITASWAAAITRVDPLATVIFFATEDPLGRVKARLRAESADLDRVLFLDITKPGASPVLPADIADVEAVIREHHAALLILDPALEFMAGELDSHKQQDAAAFMRPLLGIAIRTGASILTVRHNNKNAGASALHRAAGSIAFTGCARIVLTAAKNEESGKRALSVTKNNASPDKHTVEYDIVSKDDASVVAWGEVLNISADELVNQEPGKKKRGPPAEKLEAACDLLRSILAGGQFMAVDDVVRCAKAEGISRSRIYLAASSIRVRRGTLNGRAAWALDPELADSPSRVSGKNSGFENPGQE
mgnify:CR=1 FL=1